MKRHLVGTAILAVIIIALPTVGRSQPTPAGQRKVYGAGLDSCGKWLSESSSGKRGAQFYIRGQWVLGYLSAVNRNARTPARDTDSEAVSAWLDNYCQAHPLEDLDDAAKVLATELGARW